jgi:hypothetical protein
MSSVSAPIYKRIYVKIIAAVLCLYCLLWAISSPLIKHFAKAPLADMGLVLSPDSQIRYNPFLTRVTVTDLALTKNDKIVFSTQSLALQLALHKIPFDLIEIEELSINGITVDVEKESGTLFIAGVDLTPNNETEQKETPQKTSPEKAEPLPYKVILSSLALTNVDVNALLDKNKHTFNISTLYVNDIEATELKQSANIKLQSLINKAPLNVNASIDFNNGNGLIESDTHISQFPLANIKHLIEPLKQLDGSITFSSKQTVKIDNKNINVSVEAAELINEKLSLNSDGNTVKLDKLAFNITELSLSIVENDIDVSIGNTKLTNLPLLVTTPQNTIKLDALALDIDDISLSLINNQLNDLKGTAQLTLTNANIFGENETQQILGFDQLNLSNLVPSLINNKIDDTQPNKLPKAAIDALTINGLMFSQNKTSDLPAVAKIKQIIIKSIEGDAGSVAIDSIVIDSINSHVILNKEKALANLVALSPKTTEVEPTPTQAELAESESPATDKSTNNTPDEDTTAFLISLNEFNLINNNEIYFVDNSVNPAYKRSLMIDKLFVGALSNQKNKQEDKTPIELLGRSNQYANFTFNGFIQPFATKQTYSVKGKLRELSLPDVSTYMKEALELELTSGQLNTDVDLTLAGEDIKGDINFNIKGLETGAAETVNTNIVKEQVGIPFNAALSMLKDSNGNLELDVPLSGKTSDPAFGISSFIALITKKAVMSATESYLMKTFVPYANVVSVAMVAGEMILRLRFEDLPYEPKQASINEQQIEYVDQFIALMKDKKDTQVKLCAMSTPSDIGLDATSKLSEANIKELKDLGTEREKQFKEHAVKAGIESGRLLLCAPKIDRSKKAVPRLTISV